jgi:hypothetical protein
MADLTTIETGARIYSEEVRRLMELVGNRDAELDAITEKYELDIRRQLENCNKALQTAHMYVEESPIHFQNPKTRTFGNVKVGFVKQKDSIDSKEPELIIQRIRQLLPDKFNELVRAEFSLIKDALRNLTSEQMKLIGLYIVPGTDTATVSLMDKEVEKVLKYMEKAQKNKVEVI